MQEVRVDAEVNKHVWSQGVRNVPYRVRVKLSRRRNEDEESKSKMYTLVTLQQVATTKGTTTEAAPADEE
jgi:large subunit ribosomal protein L31e